MDSSKPYNWSTLDPSVRRALLLGGLLIVLPIVCVFAYLYFSGYAERSKTSNLFIAAFVIWLPVLILLTRFFSKTSILDRIPEPYSKKIREGAASAISISLIFAVLPIEPNSTGLDAFYTYTKYFFAMLALFAIGSIIGIGISNLWEKFKNNRK